MLTSWACTLIRKYGDDNYSVYVINATKKVLITLGDLNADGRVDVTDVSLLIDVVLGKTVQIAEEATPDLNGDGMVDVTDVSMLIDIVLGKA